NITPENPKGNRPRYPFVIVEVDKASGLLKQESLRSIDGRQDGENEILNLSNFSAHEDRETKEIVLYMTRLLPSRMAGRAMACATGYRPFRARHRPPSHPGGRK